MGRRFMSVGIGFIILLLTVSVRWAAAEPEVETGFRIVATVYVSGDYIHHEIYLENGGYIDIAVNEPIAGQVVSTDWDAIYGAELLSLHSGIASLNQSGTYLTGSIFGNFSFTTKRGALKGRLWADVTASVYTGVIYDTGTFRINNATGGFRGTKADGTFESTLYPVFASDERGAIQFDENGMPLIETYAGFITLNGKYY